MKPLLLIFLSAIIFSAMNVGGFDRASPVEPPEVITESSSTNSIQDMREDIVAWLTNIDMLN